MFFQCNITGIDLFEHKRTQIAQCRLHIRAHFDIVDVHTILDGIADHGIDSTGGCGADQGNDITGDISGTKHPCADSIVDIVVGIGDLIRKLYDLPFQRRRTAAGAVVQNAVPDFPCQIQPSAVLFQPFDYSQALRIMGKAVAVTAKFIQLPFSCMPEGCMP